MKSFTWNVENWIYLCSKQNTSPGSTRASVENMKGAGKHENETRKYCSGLQLISWIYVLCGYVLLVWWMIITYVYQSVLTSQLMLSTSYVTMTYSRVWRLFCYIYVWSYFDEISSVKTKHKNALASFFLQFQYLTIHVELFKHWNVEC
jgi:hypothetical protein